MNLISATIAWASVLFLIASLAGLAAYYEAKPMKDQSRLPREGCTVSDPYC